MLRRRHAVPDRELGLPYLEEPEVHIQTLVAYVKLCGIPIWRRVEGREEIPAWWLIQVGATGDRSGWTSRFAEYIEPRRTGFAGFKV